MSVATEFEQARSRPVRKPANPVLATHVRSNGRNESHAAGVDTSLRRHEGSQASVYEAADWRECVRSSAAADPPRQRPASPTPRGDTWAGSLLHGRNPEATPELRRGVREQGSCFLELILD
jgi:hypothetical protein